MRILVLLFISFATFGQDIFNYENSRKYGDYLLKSGQFELAGKEFERLVYFAPDNDTLKTNLLRAYRLSNQTSLGIAKLPVLYNNPSKVPFSSALEYAKLQMQNQSWSAARDFWNQNENFSADDKVLLNVTSDIFNNNFKEARTTLALIKSTDNELGVGYKSILEKETHKKSPGLAALMSAVVPGSGKAYSKNWKDGIVSLFFTAGMAFQSYRSFNKFGVNNHRGWIYGGIGLGFYLGNIYGGVKSTKDFNRKKINALQHEASALFNTYY
ncbi:hypothetical protein [Lacihabitans soyangensis]|uniref:Tetratricopeptide repeat protein n=1 Tax=Lacihabitans soyangensis TaxID=869394 RepID=A0AAE3H2I0_9BACT|nr:hypothetical protein [Lacihabitans soyangensis]MCP9762766.1 hypothetical protein [Lacihabitans soyangensis]